MSGQTDFRQIIQDLENQVQSLQTEELSLDEKTSRAEKALRQYQEIRKFFKERCFDVRMLSRVGEEISEKPFDWKGLDES